MKKTFVLLAFSWQLPAICLAQAVDETDTLRSKNELQEVVVSGSKFNERNSKLAVSIKTIRQSDLKNLNLSNAANVLESSGLVFVQKSQQGGGSPILRGFEASRVLLMVDGVRMNNAIYRAGHLQNVITVDPNILHRMEILYGPSSTLYGSDALGGVINIFTKDPRLLSPGQNKNWNVNSGVRYSSAIAEKTIHADVNYAEKKWASLTSVTFSDFGDIRSGKNRSTKYPAGFGNVNVYANQINGNDSAMANPHPNKMKPSGYYQYDILQKFLFSSNPNTSHTVNVQFSNSSNIPRFDRLSELAGAAPRFAEWYYGPQQRFLTSYKYEKNNLDRFFQEVRAVASYQAIEESRYDRRFKQSIRNERVEQIKVAGFTLDVRKKFSRNELIVGADAQLNFLKSTARGLNVDNGNISKITTRYPDGENRMHYVAIYAQHILKITDDLTLNDGLRLNYVSLKSYFNDTSLFHFPFNSAKQNPLALSGNVGLVYSPNDQFKISSVFSTGFRAPNFDDLTKVFDSRAGAVVVPNPGLNPEYTYNLELNVIKYFNIGSNPSGASIGGSVFYTWFRNAIISDRFTFNGKDSIIYSGVKSVVLASQNKAKAHLWGANVFCSLNITGALQVNATATYTHGRFQNNNTEVPLDHIAPLFGRVGLRYNAKKISAEVYSSINGWKRIKDYNPNGEDNQLYATPDGMPSWYTLNARFNCAIGKLGLQLAIENISDKHYRTFASGISAPGRNFILGVKTTL